MMNEIRNKLQSKNGITLVALVVTIIVLIILASISINVLLGENGIIAKTKNAKKQYEISVATEEIKFALLEEQINVNTKVNLDGEFHYERVWDNLRKNDSNLSVTEDSAENCYYLIYKGFKFKIDENNNVTYIGDGEKVEENVKPEPTEYIITYYKNDGTEEKIDQIVEIGTETTLSLDKFTRDGYAIEGWYANAECTGDKIAKVSNNIELYAKWESLIAEELDCLMTTGNQYIHTGVTVNQDITIEMKCQILAAKPQFLYGSRKEQMNSTYALVYECSEKLWESTEREGSYFRKGIRVDYNDTQATLSNQYIGTHVIKQEKNKFYIDNELIHTHSTGTFSNTNNGEDLVLFNVNTNGSINNDFCAELKFYYCKIWDGNTLVRDYIPIVDNKGKICLYDKIDNKLYYASYGNKQEEFIREKDFEEITAVESNGSQYIDTAFRPSSNTTLEMKVSFNNENSREFMYGARTTNVSNTYAGVLETGKMRFDYNTTHSYGNTMSKDTIYTIKQAKNIFYVNDTQVNNTTVGTFNCEYNLYLFSCNTKVSPTYNASMKLYYCKIWEGTTLVRDYIPVKTPSGIACLYDKVEQKYYYATGGDLVAVQ